MQYEAVGNVDRLTCPICLDLFKAPLELLPCRHIICKACATQLSSCPNCRAKIAGVEPANRVIVNMVEEATVRCLHCQWEGPNEHKDNHTCNGGSASAPQDHASAPPPSSAVTQTWDPKEPQRQRLWIFYQHYAPGKAASDINAAVEKYANPSTGGFDRMWELLQAKYGPETAAVMAVAPPSMQPAHQSTCAPAPFPPPSATPTAPLAAAAPSLGSGAQYASGHFVPAGAAPQQPHPQHQQYQQPPPSSPSLAYSASMQPAPVAPPQWGAPPPAAPAVHRLPAFGADSGTHGGPAYPPRDIGLATGQGAARPGGVFHTESGSTYRLPTYGR